MRGKREGEGGKIRKGEGGKIRKREGGKIRKGGKEGRKRRERGGETNGEDRIGGVEVVFGEVDVQDQGVVVAET